MPKTVRPIVLPVRHRAAALLQPYPTLGTPHPKGYRDKVGNKRFWLGRDAEQASELLRLITAEWTAVEREARAAHGRSAVAAWTADAIDRINDAKARHREAKDAAWQPVRAPVTAPALPIAAPAAAPELPVAVAQGGSTMLLSAAIKSYLDHRRLDVQAGQIQPSRMAQIHYSHARLHWAVEDQPINRIGPDQIRRIVQFERFFKYRRDNLLTDAEHEAASKVTVFTLAELRTLWQVAGEGTRSRLYIVLALNTGSTQTEIATLRHVHLHLDGPKPYIQRFRHKTKVRGKWRLWPETVTLLRRHMTDPAEHGPAILSLNGRPLVRLSESARCDDIRHDWQRVRARIKSMLKSDARTLAEWTAEFEPFRGKTEMADRILAMLPSLAPYIEGCARRKIPAFVPVRPLGFKLPRAAATDAAITPLEPVMDFSHPSR